MTALEIGLAIALGLALVAVMLLAAVLPRRIARMVSAEHARADARSLAAWAALREAIGVEVMAIVAPMRATHGEHERVVNELRALLGWLAAFTREQHERIVAAAPETTRKPERAEVPRERHASPTSAISPPGSAEVQAPEPGHRAAGLTRPAMVGPAPASEMRRTTRIGLAPQDARRPHPSAPTLVSMAAVTPTPRRAPEITIDGGDSPGGGGAA